MTNCFQEIYRRKNQRKDVSDLREKKLLELDLYLIYSIIHITIDHKLDFSKKKNIALCMHQLGPENIASFTFSTNIYSRPAILIKLSDLFKSFGQ